MCSKSLSLNPVISGLTRNPLFLRMDFPLPHLMLLEQHSPHFFAFIEKSLVSVFLYGAIIANRSAFCSSGW
jgi:hypothetical protein